MGLAILSMEPCTPSARSGRSGQRTEAPVCCIVLATFGELSMIHQSALWRPMILAWPESAETAPQQH